MVFSPSLSPFPPTESAGVGFDGGASGGTIYLDSYGPGHGSGGGTSGAGSGDDYNAQATTITLAPSTQAEAGIVLP